MSVRDHYQRHTDLAASASAQRTRTPNDDWWVVLAFYAALHLMQAYLESVGEFPSDHTARRDVLRRDRTLPRRVKDDYTLLYDVSVDVRYNPTFVMTPAEGLDATQAFDALVADLAPRVRGFWARVRESRQRNVPAAGCEALRAGDTVVRADSDIDAHARERFQESIFGTAEPRP